MDNAANTEKIFIVIYSALFMFIVFTFTIIGRKFYTKLKRLSVRKAAKAKWRVILSISIIAFSFTYRAISSSLVVFLNFKDNDFDYSLRNNTWVAPLLLSAYYLIADVLPTMYQVIGIKSVIDEKNQKNTDRNSSVDNIGRQSEIKAEVNSSMMGKSDTTDESSLKTDLY